MQISCPSCKSNFFINNISSLNNSEINIKCCHCYHLWKIKLSNKNEKTNNLKQINFDLEKKHKQNSSVKTLLLYFIALMFIFIVTLLYYNTYQV